MYPRLGVRREECSRIDLHAKIYLLNEITFIINYFYKTCQYFMALIIFFNWVISIIILI